jgi:hypothetical protein
MHTSIGAGKYEQCDYNSGRKTRGRRSGDVNDTIKRDALVFQQRPDPLKTREAITPGKKHGQPIIRMPMM